MIRTGSTQTQGDQASKGSRKILKMIDSLVDFTT